jgi:hypothetical protein
LLNMTLPLAQRILEKRAEFYPFGAAVSTGGEAQLLGGDTGPDDRPVTASVLALLLGGFAALGLITGRSQLAGAGIGSVSLVSA